MPNIERICDYSISKISKKLKSPKTTLSIVPNFSFEPDFYYIKLGRKVIGNTTFCLTKSKPSNITDLSAYPTSWATSKQGIKPYLDVQYIELLKEKKKGLGRMVMQMLYKVSKKKGCEGRMMANSISQAAGFYSHLGFDCSPLKKQKFDVIYSDCLAIAKKDNLNGNQFAHLLSKSGCPKKTNNQYNIAGMRFFIPTVENLASLFKK